MSAPSTKLCPILIFQITGTHILGIHMRFHGQQTVYQLFLGHLKTENCYCDILAKSHILGDIQYKSSLSHRRTWLRSAPDLTHAFRRSCNPDPQNRWEYRLQIPFSLDAFSILLTAFKHNLLDRYKFITGYCRCKTLNSFFSASSSIVCVLSFSR